MTPAAIDLFARIASRAPFTALVGVGMPGRPAPGVRGVGLHPRDHLAGELDVVVVGPHFSAALVARSRGDLGADAKRGYEVAVTYDRDLVIRAATALLQRVTADEAPTATSRPNRAEVVLRRLRHGAPRTPRQVTFSVWSRCCSVT